MQDALLALWQFTPVRLAFRLGNVGLNTVTVQDLLDALIHTQLTATLIAVAWLIPWERLAVKAFQHRPTLRTIVDGDPCRTPALARRRGFDLRRAAVLVTALTAARRSFHRGLAIFNFRSKYHLGANTVAT